jgi:thioredoxin 1/putative thioredoxin
MPVLSVTDATFEREVLRSEIPVLIDLHADWCQPCKQLAPIVEEVSRELEGKLKVVKIDIDRNPMVAQSFRVQSIPMLVVIHGGQVAGHHLGLLSKQQLLQLVEPVLPAEAAEVKPQELAQLLTARRAVPVDVREPAAYARYRIPGAKNVPAEQVVARAAELRPTDGRIRVLYARSTDEAKELAEKLRGSGVEVGFLAGGFLHWEADGLEVERGS